MSGETLSVVALMRDPAVKARAAEFGRSVEAQALREVWEREHGRDHELADEQGHGLAEIPDYPLGVLPSAWRELTEAKAAAGLPAALTAGAGLVSLAAAIGSRSEVVVQAGWRERPILWVPLIAPRGTGKSAAQAAALEPIRASDELLDPDDETPPVLAGDCTLEALARTLHNAHGAVALDLDELSLLLRGLGEYKRGGGDRGRFLALWDGAGWNYSRVGAGGKSNGTNLRIGRPTVPIVGGLQPELHALLGGDTDGMRPRWLPHLAAKPPASAYRLSEAAHAVSWHELLVLLLAGREEPRTWTLDHSARSAFQRHRQAWKTEASRPVPAGVAAALEKADRHLARVALVLAETEQPAQGGMIDADTIDRAAEVVRFSLTCWQALPEHGQGLAVTIRDRALSSAVDQLMSWLEARPNGKATRREIQQAHVAGCRKPTEVDALIAEYEATYPGSRTEEYPPHGGLPRVVVRAPRRTRAYRGVASGNTDRSAASAGSHGKGNAAVAAGNTGTGNTDQATPIERQEPAA